MILIQLIFLDFKVFFGPFSELILPLDTLDFRVRPKKYLHLRTSTQHEALFSGRRPVDIEKYSPMQNQFTESESVPFRKLCSVCFTLKNTHKKTYCIQQLKLQWPTKKESDFGSCLTINLVLVNRSANIFDQELQFKKSILYSNSILSQKPWI